MRSVLFRLSLAVAWGIVAALALPPRAVTAQSQEPYVPIRPSGPWRTLETAHFVFHCPQELDAWTRDAAAHIESQREAVRRLVGYAPPSRVTVLVADPYNQANGSAYPFLRGPAVFLWPVPDAPRDQIGTTRRWAELLAVHEFAHLAHLGRPTRNPIRARLARLLPTNIGPIGARTPRWVWEGYATYVEGALTGAGRPFGAWRPAVLRQWAIEGRLPSYAQISGTGGFAGGSFAYLAGSAYYEWLVRQRSDSSLPAVWRRMTARTPRSFDAAFAGVFPGAPAELYARWSAEVTAEAVAAERALRAAGLVEGTLVQRLRGATGDPAVSRDGERVALVVRTPGRASRVVVWRTGAEPRDTSRRAVAARARLARASQAARRRDPEDVPAVPYLPAPRRALATLPSRDGRPFRSPRWLPDGVRILVERDEFLGDGRVRPDVWLWDTRSGGVRRVTRGAAVRDPDPSPDGRSALATQCVHGWCDVVRIELTSGAVTMVAAGSPTRTFARPRWAPDGKSFAVASQADGPWRVVVGDVPGEGARANADLRPVGPDDGRSRFDPAFLPDGRSLLVATDVGGVPNVERLDVATGSATPVTRVTGAAMAPEPIGPQRAFYFLALRSTGYDLRRVSFDSVAAAATPVVLEGTPTTLTARVATGTAASSATAAISQRRPSATPDTFPAAPVDEPHAYGLGPTRAALLPGGAATPDGIAAFGVLAGADPVGRLSWLLVGGAGTRATWRGGSLSATMRARPVTVEAQLFGVAQRPRVANDDDESFASGAHDLRYHGGIMAIAPRAVLGSSSIAARLGASLGTLRLGQSREARGLGFGELRAATVRGRGDLSVAASATASGATGRSEGRDFWRVLGSAGVSVRSPLAELRASGTMGYVGDGASEFERFAVGGPEPQFLDAGVLGQRVAMPALPTGTIVGRRIESARVTLANGLIEPYAWAGRAPDVSSQWLRLAGAEATFASGPIPFARAPGVRVVAGAAYVFDGPTRRRVQGYATFSVRP